MKHMKLVCILLTAVLVGVLPPIIEASERNQELSTALYICSDSLTHEAVLARYECDMLGVYQRNFSSNLPPADYAYTLDGDVAGTSYSFNLMLASDGQTTFEVAIIVIQGGMETVLAATTFDVTEVEHQDGFIRYTEYTKTVTGIDPTTSPGDTLILRISASRGEGSMSAVNSRGFASYIVIPPLESLNQAQGSAHDDNQSNGEEEAEQSISPIEPGEYQTIAVTNAETVIELATIQSIAELHGLAFSPDGTILAFGDGSIVQLWNLESGTRQELTNRTGIVTNVVFSSDGTLLAAGDQAGKIRLWNMAGGVEDGAFGVFTSPVRGLAFSPDSTVLAASNSDYSGNLWYLTTNAGHSWVSDAGPITFSPDGVLLAYGSVDGIVRVKNVTPGAESLIVEEYDAQVTGVAFSPSGELLVSASADGTMRMSDVAANIRQAIFEEHTGPVLSVAFSPDGTVLVSGGADGTVRLWDVATGAELVILRGHSDSVHSVVFSADGALVASGSSDGTVRLWGAR